MREELKNIELFDLYNSGKLSASDKLDFEQKLKSDPQLEADFSAYQELMVAYHRSAMNSAILNHKAAYASQLLWKKIGIGAGVVLVGVLSTLFFLNSQDSPNSKYTQASEITQVENINTIQLDDLPTVTDCLVNEKEEPTFYNKNTPEPEKVTDFSKEAPVDFDGLKMWTQPDVETFTLNLKENEIIQGEEGTVILVNPKSFIDAEGELVTGNVELKLAEFVTVDKMVLANLTTVSNGTDLQTDGMINLEASQNGRKLKINPKYPLKITIPTDKVKADMLAFEGEVNDGNINWVNPKEMDSYLVKIDLANLDFLPEDFEKTLYRGLPYLENANVNKAFVDSCYYSLSRLNRTYEIDNSSKLESQYAVVRTEQSKADTTVETEWYNANLWQKIKHSFTGKYYSRRFNRNIEENPNYYTLDYITYCNLFNNINGYRNLKSGVDPGAVKTIRDPKFQDTWIATREFENRLHLMQKLENGQELLDTYCQNLDKNMHEIDAQVIPKIDNEEVKEEFISLFSQKHTTISNSPEAKDLSKFYNEIREKNRLEIEKVNRNLGGSITPTVVLSKKDLNSPANRQAYQFSWSGGSWINIDAYLHILSKKPSVLLPIFADDSSRHKVVYQHIGFLNNLTRLREIEMNGYVGNYPNESIRESRKERNGMAISISYQQGNKYRLGIAEFNPYKVDEVRISYELVNTSELKRRLKKLDGSKKYLDNLKKEISQTRKAILENKSRQKKLETQEEKGKEAFKFWKPLALIVYLKEKIADKIDTEREQK